MAPRTIFTLKREPIWPLRRSAPQAHEAARENQSENYKRADYDHESEKKIAKVIPWTG